MKSTISIKGIIEQDTTLRDVRVGSEESVPIRDIHLKDYSGKIKVALWRDLASSDVHVGDMIQITNMNVSSYQSEIQLGSTSLSTIKVTETLQLPNIEASIVGLQTADDGNTDMLVEEQTDHDDPTFLELICSSDVFHNTWPELNTTSLEKLLPIEVTMEYHFQTKTITSIILPSE